MPGDNQRREVDEQQRRKKVESNSRNTLQDASWPMQTSKVKSNNFLCAPRTSFNYTVEEAPWLRIVTATRTEAIL